MKQKKTIFQRVIPFRIIKNPGLDPDMYTTSRPEKIIKFPMTHRSKDLGSLNSLPRSESNKMFSTLSEKSLKILSDSVPSDGAIGFSGVGDNITRISNLRYYTSKNKPLPPIKKIAPVKESIEKQIIEDFAETEEKTELKSQKQIGYWTVLAPTGSIPNSTEGAQIAVIDTSLIVCGGQSQIKHFDIRVLDMKILKWKILRVPHGPSGRLGHTMVSYKHKLIVFGGWTTNDSMQRKTTNKMYYLSLNKNKWDRLPNEGSPPAPRQYHAAAQLGKTMIVYGGIDYNSKVRDDLYIYDIKEQKWNAPELNVLSDPGCRSHCSLTPVFHQSLKALYNFSIYKIPKLREEFTLKNSAFYLFGGLTADARPCNLIHALYIRAGSLIWSEVKCNGVGPSPRYSHTAQSIHNSLFIYGGRNDSISSHSELALDDLFVLNVTIFKWERVQVYGNIPEGRWAHSMAVYNTSIIVFGGISYHKFMSSNINILETSRVEAERRIQSDVID